MSNIPDKGVVVSPTSSSQTMLRVVAGLLAVLIGLVGFGIYKISVPKHENKDVHTQNERQAQNNITPTTQNTAIPTQTVTSSNQSPTPTQAPKHDVPAGWKAVKMPTYHYVAYRPSNYYYRFQQSGRVLGIDPNPIPADSGYAGMITLEVVTGDLENAKMEHIKDWMAIATHKKVAKNATWDLVQGTIPADLLHDEQTATIAITKKGKYVYIVDYRANSKYFDKDLPVFEKFYPAILFTE